MQNVERDTSLDFMKGMTTILMIVVHVIQYYMVDKLELYFFSSYINLTTFSAFMFCFGYVCNLAYFSKDTLPQKRIILGAIKCLFAFYISAFGIEMILYGESYKKILPILWFSHISDYSEFLLSFFYLYIVILIFGKRIKQILDNKLAFFTTIILSLALTYIPYSKITLTQLSPLLGAQQIKSFPVLQYFSYFLIGAFISKYKIIFNKKIYYISFLGTMCFFISIPINKMWPSRFPPSLYWVIGGYFPVYIYYLFSKKIANISNPFTRFCSSIGHNTLVCLVVSNLWLFVVRSFITLRLEEIPLFVVLQWYLMLSIIIMGFCFVFMRLIKLTVNRKQV